MEVLIGWLAVNNDMLKDEEGNVTGPSLTALRQQEYQKFILLFNNEDSRNKAQQLKNHVLSNKRIFKEPEIDLISVPLEDPTDYAELWALVPGIVKNEISKLGQDANITINLSPGTPAMSTTWMMMVGTGELEAKLLNIQIDRKNNMVRSKPVKAGIYPFVEKLKSQISKKEKLDQRYKSIQMHKILYDLTLIAQGIGMPILLLGETGTGKTTMAIEYHNLTGQAEDKFQKVVCGEFRGSDLNIAQSRLFGHVKGAFSGASEERKGMLEAADGGTLFLDEIGDIPLEAQRLLIDAIESGKFKKMGSNTTQESQFRLVCATNQSIDDLIGSKKLSEDFYYRFGALSFTIPPIRERTEDIPGIIEELLKKKELSDLKITETGFTQLYEELSRLRLTGNIRDINWHLMKLKLESARNENDLDEKTVKHYFKNQNDDHLPQDFGDHIRSLLKAWKTENHQDYKWKDAVFGFATQELAKDPDFQKKNGGVHISAIKTFLGLDYQTIKRYLDAPY